jgi:hypothetical protein
MVAGVAARFRVGRCVLAALPLMLVACGGSGSGGPGGGGTFTSYPGCLPPCIGNALLACIGESSVCTGTGDRLCWDTGAQETLTTTSHPDGGGAVQDDVLYAPDGSLCLTEHIVTTGPNYTPETSYYDASGNLIATSAYDPNATYGFAVHCDGNTYASKPVALTSACSDNANILTGNACTSPTFQCPAAAPGH